MILEACVDSYENALIAEQNGAHQIELCSRLDMDGLTPRFEITVALTQMLNIPIKVMIRSRAGNFDYTQKQLDHMLDNIKKFQTINIEGFVFGVSNQDKTLNYKSINQLAEACKGKSVCIHRVIDQCPDIVDAYEGLVANCPKVNFVLSSGGAKSAFEGREKLKELHEIQTDNIKLIAAGGITSENLDELHSYLGLEFYHGRNIV